jgi:hypothetical protein
MGIFRSSVTMDESVVRVWKSWLGRRTVADSFHSRQCADSLDYGIACGNVNIPLSSRDYGKGKSNSKVTDNEIAQDEDIIWFDFSKHVGLRVSVREKKWSGDPAILLTNEDEVVSYEVEYRGLSSFTLRLLITALVQCRKQLTFVFPKNS